MPASANAACACDQDHAECRPPSPWTGPVSSNGHRFTLASGRGPSSVHVAEYDGGERLFLSWDLGDVDEREKNKAIKQWCATLPALRALRRLGIWSHVTQPLFNAACAIEPLECLQIKWSNIKRLDALSALTELRYLRIGSSTRIESVAPLVGLRKLRILEIENFKLITDFSPLLELTTLQSLTVSGSMWTRQNLGSLETFARMTWLESLAIDTTHVSSLRPLARLRALDLGGRLPMAEYAWLAGQLPDTACRWFEPYLDLQGSGMGCCLACQRDSRVMLTGKGGGVLRSSCDAGKVAKHAAAFAAIKAQSAAERVAT